MAKTPADRSREFRKRQQEKLAKISAVPASYIVGDFAAFLEGKHPAYSEDKDNEEIEGPGGTWHTPEAVAQWIDERLGDIGLELDWRDVTKASAAVSALSQAATGMAELLNLFKWLEANAAIKRLQEADLSDASARDAAFREARRLSEISTGLTKTTRLNLPVTSVLAETEHEG
jgi:hypothetical protein